MRITGGLWKGRTINPPAGYQARPTTDFAKEGLFNILSNQYDFDEVSLLDLFAGTGSISLEFASRGCRDIVAVDMNPAHINFIRRTAASFGVLSAGRNAVHGAAGGIQPVHSNAFDFLKVCTKRFDIVFADPPYDMDGFGGIPDKLLASPIFAPDGILIFEHPAPHDFSAHPAFFKERKYGNVHFSFFHAPSDEAQRPEEEV